LHFGHSDLDINHSSQVLGLFPLIASQNQAVLQLGQRTATIKKIKLRTLTTTPPNINIAVSEVENEPMVLMPPNRAAVPISSNITAKFSFHICRVFLIIELSNIH
jgi:hypothetical protein